jgi:hypothetical protein
MPASDLSDLAARVRSSAIVLDNGEVMWPFDDAADAINELARSGRVILGLDARDRHDAGLATEVPISSIKPAGEAADVEHGRQAAIEALGRAERVTGWAQPNLLVTWR